MTADELKAVPATLGDPIGALASLPGMSRTGDFIGYLTARGAPDYFNGYYIDGIPLIVPQHFSGFHAVVPVGFVNGSTCPRPRFLPATAAPPQRSASTPLTTFPVRRLVISASSPQACSNTITSKRHGRELRKANRDTSSWAAGTGTWRGSFLLYRRSWASRSASRRYWDYQLKAKYSFNASIRSRCWPGQRVTCGFHMVKATIDRRPPPATTEEGRLMSFTRLTYAYRREKCFQMTCSRTPR